MRLFLHTYATALAGLLLLVVFAVAAPNFASPANLINIVKETSFLAILATGFTLALMTAELDLSVADVASLAAVVTGALISGGVGGADCHRGRDRDRHRRRDRQRHLGHGAARALAHRHARHCRDRPRPRFHDHPGRGFCRQVAGRLHRSRPRHRGGGAQSRDLARDRDWRRAVPGEGDAHWRPHHRHRRGRRSRPSRRHRDPADEAAGSGPGRLPRRRHGGAARRQPVLRRPPTWRGTISCMRSPPCCSA